MVVLSVSICTKSGKALISRQFVEMTRIRIEGLLAAFPKLISTDAKQQHTYIETESVRYVYQPMENFYLLLITNRASNIVEDLDTLRLLSKVIPSVTGTTNNLSEEKIAEKVFDLIFSFDEAITTGGYREPINLQQIRVNMEMESHEEKLLDMIKKSKMSAAKEQQAAAIKSMKEKAKENARLGFGNSTGMGSYESSSNSYQESSFSSVSTPVTQPSTPVVPVRTQHAVKGMSLGGAKNKSAEDALMKEDNLAPVLRPSTSKTGSSSATTEPVPIVNTVQHPIMLVVAEKVSASLSRDGLLEQFDIKGSLTLTAANDEVALCSVQLRQSNTSLFQFQTHPKVNKASYDKSGLLQLKDSTKGFPSVRPVGILKWNYSGTSNEDLVPIKINCWPEEEGRGRMLVTIEYSVDRPNFELHDVRIRIPLGTHEAPTIVNVDGSHKHNAQANELIWNIDLIDKSNSTGTLEFNIAQRDSDAFFPISVQFSSQQLYCNVEVASVKTVDTNSSIMYGITSGMSSEEYVIG